METKQVIVWRNELKVRKGKIAAQVAHASMAFLTRDGQFLIDCTDGNHYFENQSWDLCKHNEAIRDWLENSFKKVVVYVISEQELLDIHEKALKQGLISHLVEDNGATEFNGVKTRTCCAIGPAYCTKFVGLTDDLPLL
jgi:PTH2 family peptidyl-tRNA hydrolase